ncbi:MAG TPA: hypothetical protein VNG90_05240 [Candidatus Acidoferrum sp.]|nr:hypothetical protein [Candidatus Acidoferrum sp.]
MNPKRSLTSEECRQIVELVIVMKPALHTIIEALLLGISSSIRGNLINGGGLHDDDNRSYVVACLLNQLGERPEVLKVFLENLSFQLTHNGGPSEFLDKLILELW